MEDREIHEFVKQCRLDELVQEYINSKFLEFDVTVLDDSFLDGDEAEELLYLLNDKEMGGYDLSPEERYCYCYLMLTSNLAIMFEEGETIWQIEDQERDFLIELFKGIRAVRSNYNNVLVANFEQSLQTYLMEEMDRKWSEL